MMKRLLTVLPALAATLLATAVSGGAPAAGGNTPVSFYAIVPLQAPEYCFDLAAVSDTSLWYTTNRGLYRHNGAHTVKHLDASLFAGGLIEVFLVEALSDDDVWVLGHDAQSWRKTMYHYDGRDWSRVPFPPSDDDASDERVLFRFRVARDGAGHYGVGVGQAGLYYTFDGKRWTKRPPFTSATLRTVEVLGRNDIHAAGKDGALYHFDGKDWKALAPAGFDDTVLELAFSSPREGWAAANGSLLRYERDAWAKVPVPAGLAPRAVAAPGRSDAWLFTDNGTVLRHDGSSWSQAAKVPMQTGYASVGMAGGAAGYTMFVVTNAGIISSAWGKLPTFVDVSPAVNLHLDGGEAAVADFDGDGAEDLFVSSDGRFPDRLYANRGDGFYTEMTGRLHPPGRSIASRPMVADLDNNGLPDIVSHRGIADNLWYRNAGSWSFEELPGPVAGGGSSNYSRLAASDLDLDGDLDLVMMPNSPERPEVSLVVHLNDGAGRFRDPAEIVFRRKADAAPVGFFISDLDGDGLPDIFRYNVGDRTEFHRNAGGGAFRECAAERGLDWSAIDPSPYVTWACPVDIDRDGSPDLFVASRKGLGLFLMNDGSGRFARGDSFAFDPAGENPVGAFSDIDCDGDEDLFLLDRFYENREGKFSPYRFLGFRKTGAPSFTDIDGDGDDDMVFASLKEERGLSVFENGVDPGNVLTLDIRGTRSNAFALGAVVRLWRMDRDVPAGGPDSPRGGDPAGPPRGWVFDRRAEVRSLRPVRFALDTTARYKIEVRYPSGVVVERDGIGPGRPGTVEVREFGPVEGAWWDFLYSFRRTIVLADPLAEGMKLAAVTAGLVFSLLFATKKLSTSARPNLAFGVVVFASYILAVHGTIRQGSAAAFVYPVGGAAAVTTLWMAMRNAIEKRRRARRISHYLLGE